MEKENILLFLSADFLNEQEVVTWSIDGKQLMARTEDLEECKGKSVEFTSFCAGILCYRLESQAILVSPLKEEVLVLREPRREFLETTKPAFGFGFSKSSGVYKIVCLENTVTKIDRYKRYRLTSQVMTLGSAEWRVVPNVPNVLCALHEISSVFENGFIYWLVGRKSAQELLAFDVENEVFTILPTPSNDNTLIDLGGKLALGRDIYGDLECLDKQDFCCVFKVMTFEMIVSQGYSDTGLISSWKKYEFTYDESDKLFVGVAKENSSVLFKLPEVHMYGSYNFVTKTLTKVHHKLEMIIPHKTLKVTWHAADSPRFSQKLGIGLFTTREELQDEPRWNG